MLLHLGQLRLDPQQHPHPNNPQVQGVWKPQGTSQTSQGGSGIPQPHP